MELTEQDQAVRDDNMDTTIRFFQVERHDLVYLKFILEAHEGLATLSTADRMRGIVRISYVNFFAPVMETLLAALQQEIPMTECTAHPG